MDDGRIFQGEIRGLDTMKDLAVIKIKASDLPVPEIAKDNDLKIGQMAIVSPLGLVGGLHGHGRKVFSSSSSYFVSSTTSIP